jgi:hypothetical protein
MITKMEWGHLEIFSRTTEAEELIFTCKLSDLMQIQVCSNHGPRGSGGATIGKTTLPCVYIEKKKSSPEPAGQFLSNLVQIILWVRGILNCSN